MSTEVTLGDIDLNTVKARTVKGILTLISRSFIIQNISTFGFFLLSVFLGRPEIGLFIAVNDLVSVLGYFSDIGLAASLIQKKDKISLSDLRTTFTFQQILVLALILLSVIFAPGIFAFYKISGAGVWLFYSLLGAFFLASLKTIPSVILERQLKFDILAAVEVVETLVFYSIAVILAWQGQGIAAYAVAVIVRGLLGTSLLYLLAPWKIGFSFSFSSLKSLLSFGLPFQINSLLAVIKDRFLNIALWKIIGADGIGIIGWAQTWSQKPLRFIMDNVTKVAFPSFSRMQDHPAELKHALERTLYFICLITFPVVAAMALFAPDLVSLIPKYQKWSVALIPLSLYAINSALAAISTPITNTLYALGKAKINTYLMIMWTVLAWLFTPLLAYKFGYLGVAYATALISLTSFVPVIIIRKFIPINIFNSFGLPALATLGMVVVSLVLKTFLPPTWVGLIVKISCAVLTYAILLYAVSGPLLFNDLVKIFYAFKKPHQSP